MPDVHISNIAKNETTIHAGVNWESSYSIYNKYKTTNTIYKKVKKISKNASKCA